MTRVKQLSLQHDEKTISLDCENKFLLACRIILLGTVYIRGSQMHIGQTFLGRKAPVLCDFLQEIYIYIYIYMR